MTNKLQLNKNIRTYNMSSYGKRTRGQLGLHPCTNESWCAGLSSRAMHPYISCGYWPMTNLTPYSAVQHPVGQAVGVGE